MKPRPNLATRKARTERAHAKYEKIRKLFAERYTNQRRVKGVRVHTSAYVIACLADEFYLSVRTVENIVYNKTPTLPLPAAAAPGAEAAGGALATAA